jgi:hypothetical protein
MADIPAYGTRDYRLWEAGALAEVHARKEGRSAAGLEVLSYVDALARTRPGRDDLSESEIATRVFYVYTAGLPFWRRVRLAWRAVSRG